MSLGKLKIISGGQTGADRGALIAAQQLGLDTGGWMPKGYKAQDGSHPEFKELYNIQEHTSPYYQPRTALNVKESDATVRVAIDWNSPGERFTYKMILQYKKLFLDIDALDESMTPNVLSQWIEAHNIQVLNVAGNSERTAPGIQDFTIAFLLESLG